MSDVERNENMDQLPPWGHHPDLSESRLKAVAQIIQEQRHAALDLYDERHGDDPWCYGCRAYSWSRFGISQMAGQPGFEWLYVEEPGMQFVFLIGSVPIRFYKGEPENPRARTLRQTLPELRQLDFGFSGPSEKLLWRFAVETDIDGSVSQISFVGLSSEGRAVCNWPVPLSSSVRILADLDGDDLPEPVDVPPPSVGLPQGKVKRENEP